MKEFDKLELKIASESDINVLKAIYDEAFPRSERKPFSVIERNARKGKMEILAIYGKELCGLVITAMHRGTVLVDYFAISKEMRGHGVGSKAIELIRERYKDKKVFLEIEYADNNEPSDSQKSRRKSFYLRNGLKCADINVSLFGVPMEILSFGESFTADDCKALYKDLYGRMYRIFIKFKGE